jgi:hypothetical protein
MKKIILALALIQSSAAFAWSDCTQMEAQFIGTVKSIRVEKIDKNVRDCFLQFEFQFFSSSMTCPLDIDSALVRELPLKNCASWIDVGSQLSGILVLKGDKLSLD